MKILIGETLTEFDSEKEPIFLGFKDDAERKKFALTIMTMREGTKIHSEFPKGFDVKKITTLIINAIKILKFNN
jgi:hypothetical protein